MLRNAPTRLTSGKQYSNSSGRLKMNIARSDKACAGRAELGVPRLYTQ